MSLWQWALVGAVAPVAVLALVEITARVLELRRSGR